MTCAKQRQYYHFAVPGRLSAAARRLSKLLQLLPACEEFVSGWLSWVLELPDAAEQAELLEQAAYTPIRYVLRDDPRYTKWLQTANILAMPIYKKVGGRWVRSLG